MNAAISQFLWTKQVRADAWDYLRQNPALYISIKNKVKPIRDELLISITTSNNDVPRDGVNIDDLFYLADQEAAGNKYVCQSCGAVSRQFFGRCSSCGAWNSLVEERIKTTTEPNEEERAALEMAVIAGLMQSSGLPRQTTYCGRPINQDSQEDAEEQAEIGFVYFVRNEDLFKIGITANLLRRFKEIKPHEALNVVRCKNRRELEDRLHKRFEKKMIPQTEYFRLDTNEVAEVHKLIREWAEF